jgi:hypothetical protein
MIRDARTATRVLELGDNANELLMESLELVRTSCPKEEYDAYLPGIAQATRRLFFLVMHQFIFSTRPSSPLILHASLSRPGQKLGRYKKSN